MTTVAAPTTYTPLEVARLSNESGKLYELIHGKLVEKGPMSTRANWVAGRVTFLLNSTYPISRGYVFVEQPTYCFEDPSHMRRPDVSLVWAERLPAGLTDDELYVAPDLVVEVVSPSNTYADILLRLRDWFEAGVPIILVIEPALRWAHVYRRGGSSVTLLREGDTLTDEPQLPGLVLRMVDLFPPSPAKTQ
jgi:Uma2 family endonuclease